MSNSVVDICNRALATFGAGRINSLDEPNENARACSANYSKSLECVLQEAKWNSATFRAVLAKDSSAPAFEFQNRFLLPSNPRCLRPIGLYGSDSRWVREGRYILCDDDVLYLKYIGYVDDPNQFDALLSDAVSKRLALDIVGRLTKEKTAVERAFTLYQKALESAMAADALEGTPEPIRIDDWLTSWGGLS